MIVIGKKKLIKMRTEIMSNNVLAYVPLVDIVVFVFFQVDENEMASALFPRTPTCCGYFARKKASPFLSK